MVHLERIHEEIRVLNIKDETLLSFRVFVNFSKRIDLLHGINMGILHGRDKLTEEEIEEKKYLDQYFKTLKKIFPHLYEKWYRRSI